MSFEQFQNLARLYVIDALEPEEKKEFETARRDYGQAAEDFVAECYKMHEAFALSLRREKSAGASKDLPICTVWIDPGRSSAEELQELLAALSNLNRTLGGNGLLFVNSDKRIFAFEAIT